MKKKKLKAKSKKQKKQQQKTKQKAKKKQKTKSKIKEMKKKKKNVKRERASVIMILAKFVAKVSSCLHRIFTLMILGQFYSFLRWLAVAGLLSVIL